MPNMSSFVLFHFGDKVIAIPFLKTRCWERLDRNKLDLNAPELPEKYEPCWETYCSVPVTSCIFRQRRMRLNEVDLSGFQLTEADEPTPLELLESLYPGLVRQLIRRTLFPAPGEMPMVCALYPEGVTDPVEYVVVINPVGFRLCSAVAAARRLSCGACKTVA